MFGRNQSVAAPQPVADDASNGLGIVFFNEGGRIGALVKVNGAQLTLRGTYDAGRLEAADPNGGIVLKMLRKPDAAANQPKAEGVLTIAGESQPVVGWINATEAGTKILGLSKPGPLPSAVDCPW